jgi:hypothetical protein
MDPVLRGARAELQPAVVVRLEVLGQGGPRAVLQAPKQGLPALVRVEALPLNLFTPG